MVLPRPRPETVVSIDKILSLLSAMQAIVVSPGFAWLQVHSPKGSRSYDPDDVMFDLLSTVALFLLLAYGLWTRRAWSFVALTLGSGAALAAVLALPRDLGRTWWSIPLLFLLLAYGIFRFRLEPRVR